MCISSEYIKEISGIGLPGYVSTVSSPKSFEPGKLNPSSVVKTYSIKRVSRDSPFNWALMCFAIL